jgi:PhoH-like ATPase
MTTRDIFILDTSVLIYNPSAYKDFNSSDVCIPITVLEELDKLKKQPNEVGKNARVAIRNIDEISNAGELHIGIKIDNDIVIKVDASNYGSVGKDSEYGDNAILACAVGLKKKDGWNSITLVSRDINLRIRAKALGLLAVNYEKDNVKSDELFEGFRTIQNEEIGEALKDAGIISVGDYEGLADMFPNEYVSFVGKKKKGISLGRKIGNQIKLVKDVAPWGLELRNMEQLIAADMLIDVNIPLITLTGRSGCGKTLVALACALELVLNKRQYESLIIYRPMQPVGAEIGFLPGLLEEKLSVWFAPIDDAFSLLFSDKSRKKDGWKTQLHQYLENGTIQKNALTYIRGRSIPNSLILIDESQNLTQEEAKAILTRAGVGSRIIMNGDIEQIDNRYLDATNNGLSYVIEKFKYSELAGHITFHKGERSDLATKASEIL